VTGPKVLGRRHPSRLRRRVISAIPRPRLLALLRRQVGGRVAATSSDNAELGSHAIRDLRSAWREPIYLELGVKRATRIRETAERVDAIADMRRRQ
jgi:hypothetical protein